MHYRVNGLIIRSENAAKPLTQANKFVLNWIATLPPKSVALDYGCGKFRYTIPLARVVRTVVAVDSTYQISRLQVIADTKTSLISYADDHLPNVSVLNVRDPSWQRAIYDVALCANVLSTIPFPGKRRAILRRVGRLLNQQGRLFVCTQYRNTYFKAYATDPQAKKYGDGWLIHSRHGTAFYGILDKAALMKLCGASGLAIADAFTKGESAYVIARRR